MQARGRLDEGNEFNKSSLGSHMLATLPEGESKDSVRAAKGKTSYAPHSSPYGDTFPPGGRLKMLLKVAFSDGRLPKQPLTKTRQEALFERKRGRGG